MTPSYARARQSKRATYDEDTIHAILDEGLVGHVGFIAQDRPMVIPMAYARIGRTIYLHGSSKARIALLDGAAACLEVTRVTGIVAARSGLHHSANYRCAIVHGTMRKVTGEERGAALDAIIDHLLPGRSAEIRTMNAKEDKATGVIALEIEHASAKIRNGPPADEAEDVNLPIWAGVVPVVTALGMGLRDGFTPDGMPEAPSVGAARRKFA